MNDGDVKQMRRMRKSGIPTCKIYDSFVSQRGSYDMVGFCKKDMYNKIERDRRGQDGDVKEAEKFLISLGFKDPKLYCGHKVDRLLHIFWCDGMSQIDYDIFGDVAFDATYGRNKYKYLIESFPNCSSSIMWVAFIRNVTCNVRNERFSKLFKECMLGDLDIEQFEQKWASAVEGCHLGGNVWVEELYNKKEM
ncbi:protein FAR1-RELATED SEQUENCE 5-like [Abrus precatorius]|uniref:Protein FAR1-RELATED SEQUENCE 5-like n=1 Tax=Abrus precatorius TaxID=3816 RepID=A0A8B8KRL4_ABRPR|nr:protein FAR1-RELATED SEQUENCE 5-like [Abrus precatorius]